MMLRSWFMIREAIPAHRHNRHNVGNAWTCRRRIKMHWCAHIMTSSQAVEHEKKYIFLIRLGLEIHSFHAHFPFFDRITGSVASLLLWLLFGVAKYSKFHPNTSLLPTNCCHTQAWNDPKNTPSDNKTWFFLWRNLIFCPASIINQSAYVDCCLGFEILYLVGRYAKNHPIKLLPFPCSPPTSNTGQPLFLDCLLPVDCFMQLPSHCVDDTRLWVVAWSLGAEILSSGWLLCGANAKLTNSMPKKGPSSQHPKEKWLPNSVDLFVWCIWRLSGGGYRDRIPFLTCILCECSQWRIQIFDKKINLLQYLTYLNI